MREPDVKKPQLQGYGLTPEEYGRYRKLRRVSSEVLWARFGLRVWLTAGAVGIVTWITTDHFTDTASFYGIVSFCVTAGLLWLSLSGIAKFHNLRNTRMWQNSTGIQIQRYQWDLATYLEAERKTVEGRIAAERVRREAERQRREAERAERRKLLEYWESLRDTEFEEELAVIYRHKGYHVKTTPTTGDQGVDLFLKKDGKTSIVQCKGQKDRAAPAIVLQTIGARVNRRADNAVVACTAEFTQGATKVAKHNGIKLISAAEIARMAGSVAQSKQRQLIPDETASFSVPEAQVNMTALQQQLIRVDAASDELAFPRCGNCGSEMTLGSSKYDKFWRCGRFPKCKGVRIVHQGGHGSLTSVAESAQMGKRVKQPERATLKQPATSKTTSPKSHIAPTTQARGGVKQPERTVSRKPLSQDCQPVLNVLVAAALWHSWSYGKAVKASSGDVPGTQNAKAREILIGVCFVTRDLSFDSGQIWIGPTSQG